MPKTDTKELRIYCLCGQKMKVTSSMFGRPGKCVACRQKMRVPSPEELPQDTTVIYLKDYPQFLRKPAAPPPSDGAEEIEEHEEALGDGEEQEPRLPFDVLEPLRLLCSYEVKVQRQLESLRNAKPNSPAAREKAALLGYRALARKARNELDEHLRHRLMETTEQLAGVKEQIARASLSLRIGESHYVGFQQVVMPLRHRRDRLERRLHNLRGWLRVNDPWLAGGYIDVPLEDAPIENIEVTFPASRSHEDALVNRRVEDLRAAMRLREQAELKLGEWRRMAEEGTLAPHELQDCVADGEAALARSRQEVAFARARLEQIVADCESDTRAIKAHLELARHRLEAGEIERHAYQHLEDDLLRGQSDNAKARDLARRALHANSLADVPHPQGTFLRRLAAPAQTERGLALDSFLAWGASLLMILSIIIPIADVGPAGDVALVNRMALGLFFSAGLVAISAVIPRRDLRGTLLSILWIASAIGITLALQQARQSLGPVGTALRSNPTWYLNWGILLQFAALVLLGCAAAMSLAPLPRLRALPAAAALVIVLATAIILTDGYGYLGARATLAPPQVVPLADDETLHEVTITIQNDGGRTISIGEGPTPMPHPHRFFVEKRIGNTSWDVLDAPHAVQEPGQDWQTLQAGASLSRIVLMRGQQAAFRHRLGPGEYRVQLIAPNAAESQSQLFTIESPPEPEPAVPANDLEDAMPPESAMEVPQALPVEPEPGVEVELQGIINAVGREPRFAVLLHYPGQPAQSLFLRIGDTLLKPWSVREFSPVNQSVTLTNGSRFVILKSGERLGLELPGQ